MEASEAVDQFNRYLKKKRHKLTRQRSIITEVFFDPERRAEHPTVEELFVRVRARESNIGYATIYRTLKLLVEAGLAIPNRIGDDQTRYEPDVPGEHHDHMICERCGLIVEFEDPEIERLQEQIAKRLGFQLHDHNMNLIGDPMDPCVRPDCRAN